MKINKVITMAIIILMVAAAVLIFSNKIIKAETNGDISTISAKLDEVLGNQRSIMQDLSSIKQELNIIKIRVTQQQ
jgi:cell division protein FtsL